VFIGSSRNLKALNGVSFMLETGSHKNESLQKDWNALGKASFEIEILEILKCPEIGYFNEKKELEDLKAKWIEKHKHYSENSYN
jgi:hypothetical protein